MRCFSLSLLLRCTRNRCAVSPAAQPSRIVAQCAEVSNLTHLRSHMSKYPALVKNLSAPPVCANLMRCFSLSTAPRCTRNLCAVSPALAPSCIVTQCVEISNLARLLSHISRYSALADSPQRCLCVHTKYDAPPCHSHLAALVANAQRLQHSHPHALQLSALRYPTSRTCVVACRSTLPLQTTFGAACLRISNAIYLSFAPTSLHA